MNASPSPKSLLKASVSKLQAHGYKITPQRLAILKAALTKKKAFSHICIQNAIEMLDRKINCDLVTIYRNLAVFESVGIIQRSSIHYDRAYFEVLSLAPPACHQIICVKCHRVDLLDAGDDIATIKGVIRSAGYVWLRHRIEVHGLCSACSGARA